MKLHESTDAWCCMQAHMMEHHAMLKWSATIKRVPRIGDSQGERTWNVWYILCKQSAAAMRITAQTSQSCLRQTRLGAIERPTPLLDRFVHCIRIMLLVCYKETQWLGMYRQSEAKAGNQHRRHTHMRNASLPTQANNTARCARKQPPNQGTIHAARVDTTHTSHHTACHHCARRR